jgi:hypothetical protein
MMSRRHFLQTILCSSLLCSSISLFAEIDIGVWLKQQQTDNKFEEKISIPIPDEETKKWQLTYTAVQPDGQYVLEWVPTNESAENSKELLQVQFFPKDIQNRNAAEFASTFIKIIKERFPDITVNIISQKDDDTIFEWSLPKNENGEVAQYEIARIISTPKGVHRIAFTYKTVQMSNEVRDQWLNWLTNAKLEKLE